MVVGNGFGDCYFVIEHAKAVIGVIPDNGHMAIFQYFADVVAEDIHNIDACVLRISSQMGKDADKNTLAKYDHLYISLELDAIPNEKLKTLKMTGRYKLEESVLIINMQGKKL